MLQIYLHPNLLFDDLQIAAIKLKLKIEELKKKINNINNRKMKKQIFTTALMILFAGKIATAQVGIGVSTANVNPSAQLEVSSTTKGFLPPRLTITQRDSINNPATGLIIFNITTNSLEYKSSTDWISLTTVTPTTSALYIPSIVIGTQEWMEENLDVVTYRDGDIIPQVTDPTAWATLTTGAWCYYNNDPVNGAKYGKLYNWYALNDPRGLAPEGWHIPTDVEWSTLGTFLGGDAISGRKMKKIGFTLWTAYPFDDYYNLRATNESGFSGLPGGSCNMDGTFTYVGYYGFYWSATEGDATSAWNRYLRYNNSILTRSNIHKNYGFSVRCVRD
jgi:uncharacterized protein (TIGR02145 family)